ncbi:MAG: long-chain fatty acid--CoA ligase [Desulfobacter sp.]|nr:MAG: long-chain fatty acid--CoA ligase [Desulfobacter sp.]
MNINIGTMFANRAFLSPDLEACIGTGYRYTYDGMNRRINRFAAYLSQAGVRTGDRIAVLAKNNEQVLTTLFGAAKKGVITVVLNFRLTAPELSYILNDSGSTLLVYGDEFYPTVERLKSGTPVEDFIAIENSGDPKGPDKSFESVLADMGEEEPVPAGSGSDPAVLMYTSGTTGNPKGAVLTHDNCFWAAVGLVHSLEWTFQYRFLSVAPLFHIGGLAPIFANIHVGCPMVFMPDFDPAAAWEIIEKEKITFAMTVPVMLQYMAMVPGFRDRDLSALKYFICGGAPVPQSLIQSYDTSGIDVYQVYGATEYSGAITFWTKAMGLEKSDSMGKPVFHGDIKIMDPVSGKELETGGTGEICIFGPQVFKGYWENPEATAAALVDGYYRSGDLGRKDKNGFIYVVDRLKDMIISGGENIYPAELESVITAHPKVAEAAVIGKPDGKWGEIPVAFIVPAQDAAPSPSEIIDHCRQNLAGFKCVKEIHFIDQVPRNTLGKVLKRSLKDQIKDRI